MILPIEARFESVRPDGAIRSSNPLESSWSDIRPMYMRYAPDDLALVPRGWLPWALQNMRRGNIGGLDMTFNWMYRARVVKDLRLTSAQIDSMYKECFKRAVPHFLSEATEAAIKGNVHYTCNLLEDAKLCASKVGVNYNEKQADVLVRQSVEVALPLVLKKLDGFIQRDIRHIDDYDQLCVDVSSAQRYARYLGLNINRRVAVAEHRVVFQKSHWYPARPT